MVALDADCEFLWAYQYTSDGNLGSSSITALESGGAAVTGTYFYNGIDFQPGISGGESDGMGMYLLTVDQSGNFKWGTTANGFGASRGLAVTSDADDNVFVAGLTDYKLVSGLDENQAEFYPGDDLYFLGDGDSFIAKYSSTGEW